MEHLVLFPVGLFLLLGLGVIGFGIYALLCGLPASQTQQWRKDLISWQILGPDTLFQTLTDVKRSRDYLISISILAGGIGIVLSMVGWTIIALVPIGMEATTNNNGISFFLASVFLSLGILGSGAVFAAWRLRNIARRGVTYADLRQRRLSDYRSNAFFWLAMAMIVWASGVLLFFAPHVGSTLQIDLSYIVLSVPNTVSGLSIIPGTMLLVFVLVEIILFRIVSFSRLLVTSDTRASQHADDMLRATVIGSVQYCELIALGYLTSLIYNMLLPRLMASHYWHIGYRPYEGLLTISLFMPAAMQLVGAGIILMRGHLGGKVSRWPWQTKHIKQLEVGQ